MGLDYTADGDRVLCAANAALDLGATGTIMFWYKPTSDSLRQNLYERNNGTTAYFGCGWRADLAGDEYQSNRQRGTSDVQVNVNAGNFAAYGINKWLFQAMVFDCNGSNSDCKMLMGDLTTPAAEPSAYNTQSVGSGTPSTSYGGVSLCIGNNQAATTRETQGTWAWFGISNLALTIQQIRMVQWNPRGFPGMVFSMHLGFNGTSSQADLSGNGGTGTVTGSAVGSHVPLNTFFGGNRLYQGNFTVPPVIPSMNHGGMFFAA